VTAQSNALKVTSHVARDFLQSAALFHQVPSVIWEYVSNGLQYVDAGTQPHITIRLEKKPKRIVIRDNGRGMDRGDLERFFTMHAENIDRTQGRPGRGYFGTGKSAAFAVADVLRISTTKDRQRSIVELRRSDLDSASSGQPVPVRAIEMEVATREANGTLVEIEQLKNVRIDRDDIVRTLERNIRHWPRAIVELDGIVVETTTPPVAFQREFVADETEHPAIHGCRLIVNAAKVPLAEHDRGIAILAHGVLHDTTLAGSERKELVNYIFGEIDVPALAEPYEGIAAFDMSRSGRLNPENPVVFATYAFVGRHVEDTRKHLVELDKQRRAQAETARLQVQAQEIARIINDDYSEFRRRFSGQSSSLGGADPAKTPNTAAEGPESFFRGGDDPAKRIADEGSVADPQDGNGTAQDASASGPSVDRSPPEEADDLGHDAPSGEGKRKKAGGFDVQYRNGGYDTPRAFYERDSKTIFINLDHPQIVAARGLKEIEDSNFRRLSFEVAFTEYAVGFAQEMATAGYYQDVFEPLQDMRDRIDSVSRKAADMFKADQ
jgi:hypothetical protein